MPDRLVMSSRAQATDVIARAVAAAALATLAMERETITRDQVRALVQPPQGDRRDRD